MTNQPTTINSTDRPRLAGRRRSTALGAVVVAAGALLGVAALAPAAANARSEHGDAGDANAELAAANLATAAFQDVEVAEAGGYASTLDTLGCFHDPAVGGMGLHYLNESLMDGAVALETPEALVYELDNEGQITELVAHEYIVPVDAWSESAPPSLFGQEFHQHPTLPLWVLHAWIWKDNPAGVFQDFNPRVRLCPAGVPIFGEDLP
jgi:hypothetical protein